MNFIFRRMALLGIPLSLASTCALPVVRADEAAAAAAASTTQPAQTQTPTISADAQQLLAQNFAAYRALKSYSSTVSWQEAGTARGQSGSGRVVWQKPNRVLSEVQVSSGTAGEKRNELHIFDGAKTVMARTRDNRTRYVSEAQNKAAEGVAQALAPVDISGLGVAALLSGRSPLSVLRAQLASATARTASANEVAGLESSPEELDVVEIALKPRVMEAGGAPTTVTATFIMHKIDHLLRRVRIEVGSGAKARSLTETYTKLRLDPDLNALTFTYAPPLQARRIAEFAEGYDDRLEKGGAPFAIDTTDLGGKKIALTDFKNRVVLLDFWATWCPPCRDEMPNVVAAYNKHHPKGFDIVGVSLDQNKGALQSYIAQNKMPWRQIFDGQGWSSSLVGKYGVTGIPFSLLIGRDGKIAAINPRGPLLESAVKAALAKKVKR